MPILARSFLRPAALTGDATAKSNELGVADLSSTSLTYTLPTAHAPGDRVGLKLGTASGARTATLARDGLNTIDGATSVVLYVAGDYVEVEWTGSTWLIVSEKLALHVARGRNTVSQSGIVTSTLTRLALDTIDHDPAGLLDLSNDTYTVRRAGLYRLSAYCAMLGVIDAGEFLAIHIYINGTSVKENRFYSPATDTTVFNAFTEDYLLAASNTVEFYVAHNEGNNQSLANGSTSYARSSVVELR